MAYRLLAGAQAGLVIVADGREQPAMKHVHEFWFERVARRSPAAAELQMSHVLVIVTDLISSVDVLDFDGLDYLEGELRRLHPEADEIRFIPLGRK